MFALEQAASLDEILARGRRGFEPQHPVRFGLCRCWRPSSARPSPSSTTSWSSGIVRLHYTLEPLARMAWYGREMFETWADAVGGDCGFHRTGFLVLLADDEVEGGRAVVEMQRRIGIDARFIDTEEVGELTYILVNIGYIRVS